VRQNDVAFYVYPSLNTSRFEHVLGTCRVAGMMAESLTNSPKWRAYLRDLKGKTGISSKQEFVQLARLYALLHDVGHLPLSHLFELAVEEYAVLKTPRISNQKLAEEWTGVAGFEKLHEAFGAVIVKQMIPSILLPRELCQMLTRLMAEKTIPPDDPLCVVKSLVDSEIDADRIDSTQRDGLLAGREYGNYDTRRLCDSVVIEKDKSGWLIAYSEKGLTSMEALLLDRYRTHVWIHFHHRVVAIKILTRFLLEKAFEREIITKEQFNPADQDTFALRDDVWLWNVLRGMDSVGDPLTQMIQRAVFYREKNNVLNLWKGRLAYRELEERIQEKARVNAVNFGFFDLYLQYLKEQLKVPIFKFESPFVPISERAVLIYAEKEKRLSGKSLVGASRLVADLNEIWKSEPQRFLLLVNSNIAARVEYFRRQWIELTARWIRK
ncbi:HD domain-containing protein, partial [Candidatus Kaiserbacteria bacterium]|nr:HD domain-containing protein [Candidatus Kaiserbacteria bacterium]